MRSTILFIILLVFVSSSIQRIDDSVDLDSIPQFVELTSSPISKVFLSAISLRMKASPSSSAGFSKVMALIEDLIRDNRNQLQSIRRINQRVEGQCLVSNNKLVNRERSFASLLRYFKSRGELALSEKTEAINMQSNRNEQASSYAAAQTRFNQAYTTRVNKWNARVKDLEDAVTQVTAALKAVSEWTPVTKTSFIEEKIQDSVHAYQKSFNFPLTYDADMIQLSANDTKVRQRLYEWLNMLKASILNQLVLAQRSRTEVTSSHSTITQQITNIIKLEKADSARLAGSINNWTILIKNYGENEKIYSALSIQTSNVLKANREWCATENTNYTNNRKSMESQLNVFVELKEWLRKNYSRVREWLRKKYNQ